MEKLPLLTQGRPCMLCCVLAGFRRLGFGYLVSSLAVPFIHGSFSYPSNPGIIPDPFFRIWLKNIHRTKHGSDSGESWVALKLLQLAGLWACGPERGPRAGHGKDLWSRPS